jgi:hypothetical protein
LPARGADDLSSIKAMLLMRASPFVWCAEAHRAEVRRDAPYRFPGVLRFGNEDVRMKLENILGMKSTGDPLLTGSRDGKQLSEIVQIGEGFGGERGIVHWCGKWVGIGGWVGSFFKCADAEGVPPAPPKAGLIYVTCGDLLEDCRSLCPLRASAGERGKREKGLRDPRSELRGRWGEFLVAT